MPLKVLIIDDHADYRRLLSHHITTRWADAVIREYDPVASGLLPDGFSGAGNDVVLLGSSCGGGDPIEWLIRFRQQPRFPAVIVVGNGQEKQIIAAVRAGADDYVGKPGLNHTRLTEAIEAAQHHRATQLAVPAVKQKPASPNELIPGLKQYELIRSLADGEVSTVHLVRDKSTGRETVLKVLRQMHDAGSERLLDRFLREYELIAAIRHPNVVRIYDFGVADDHAYIAMEYCGAGSLKRRIAAGLDHFEAWRLMHDIAGALGALHEAGILHRDLKPTNVLFRDDGTLAVIDFGLARQVAMETELTGAGAIFGTPYYVSPEQGHGEAVDARGDIYSLGVIFYEMLTGRKPFEGDTAMGVIVKHRQAPIPPLPPALDSYSPIVNRMLAKNPADRFQSVAELLRCSPVESASERTQTTQGIVG